MYKGYKVTKKLLRYMEYAKNKYEKLNEDGGIDLWDILAEYDFIMNQPKCIQMFLYDMICDKFVHHGEYSIVRAIDGGVYVKKLGKCKA